jgi:hypothetical protein
MDDVALRGTLEDARAMIGYETAPVTADVPIERGLVLAFASIIEDPNPCYWDPELSVRLWGFEIAPPTLIVAVFSPLRWTPDWMATMNPGTIARSLVPLPGDTLINVSTTQTYRRPLRVGDWLSRTERLDNVSPEKKTALGVGHFVTTTMSYRDQHGDLVSEGTNVLLRYTAGESEGAR